MYTYQWNNFLDRRWNISHLNQLKNYSQDYIIPANLQINYLIIQLCCRRNNLNLPIEIWNIICEYIKKDIQYFSPKKWILSKTFKLDIVFTGDKKGFSCDLKKNFANFKDVSGLEKYIRIGKIGFFEDDDMLKKLFVIIDVNYEYKMISIIWTSAWFSDAVTMSIDTNGIVHVYTYDNFVHAFNYILFDDPVNYVFPEIKIVDAI